MLFSLNRRFSKASKSINLINKRASWYKKKASQHFETLITLNRPDVVTPSWWGSSWAGPGTSAPHPSRTDRPASRRSRCSPRPVRGRSWSARRRAPPACWPPSWRCWAGQCEIQAVSNNYNGYNWIVRLCLEISQNRFEIFIPDVTPLELGRPHP